MIDPLLTPEDLERIFQCSLRTVYRHWRKWGGFYIPGTRLLRFKLSTIERMMGVQVGESRPRSRPRPDDRGNNTHGL